MFCLFQISDCLLNTINTVNNTIFYYTFLRLFVLETLSSIMNNSPNIEDVNNEVIQLIKKCIPFLRADDTELIKKCYNLNLLYSMWNKNTDQGIHYYDYCYFLRMN